MQKEQELINSNYSHNVQIQRDILANILYNIIEQQKEGAKIRSRAKWIEQEERCTKYFYNLEKRNASNNNIKQLKSENDTYETSKKDILEQQYKFCKILYESDNISDEKNQELFRKNN